jgi:hypothetical protein
MTEENPNGHEPFLSMREAVMEIRQDVKGMQSKLDRIDREGSIGTKQELIDHEARIRGLERFRYSLPSLAAITLIADVALGLYIALNT